VISNRPPPARVEAYEFLAARQAAFIQPDSAVEVAEPLRPFELADHFERGGFVDSLYATSIRRSEDWRDEYLRDRLPALPTRPDGAAIDPTDFWPKLAFFQAEPQESLRRALKLDRVTFGLIVTSLLDHDLINQLEFWPEFEGDPRSPLIYMRDSGLWHRLYAGIKDPIGKGSNVRLEGKAWEAFNVEALRGVVGSRAQPFVWRRDNVGEIDLVLVWANGLRWGLEISRSPSKRPSPGFHLGCDVQGCERRMVVCPTTGDNDGRSVETFKLEDALVEIAKGPI
jgi:uncharacterized protein